MKHLFLLVALLPLLTLGQSKAKAKQGKTKTKTEVKPKAVTTVSGTDFEISGTAVGFSNGTPVALLNGQGMPEQNTIITDGKFSFKGAVSEPQVKVLAFNNMQPYVLIFLDNSKVTVKVKSGELDKAEIIGSASHNEFNDFTNIVKPYESIFNGMPATSFQQIDEGASVVEKYIIKNPDSYITPIAILRYHQLVADEPKLKNFYQALTPRIQQSQMGQYLSSVIAQSSKFAVGSQLPDFSQESPEGNMVSLSSLKGKYVLIDFWASWCKPCRLENPNVVAAFTKYKNKGFTVFGVSLDQKKDAWMDAIKADNLTWPHVSDLKGWANAVAVQFGIQSIPQNILIDPQGRVVATNLRGVMLDYKLHKLFN